MAVPRILIVDDQRDITRMLRAALETLGRGYVIVDVPSAEEGLLEMRRGQFDLLITDLRLPGISGLELIRRLRKASNEAQMMVISAYADEQTRSEIGRLGAAFFSKPLGLETFLNGVRQALGRSSTAAVANPAPLAALAPADHQTGIADRLSRLRRDLGAESVFLVDLDGKIAVRAGDVAALDLNAVITPLMAAFSSSHKVGQMLGGAAPTNVHFFDGEAFDLYAASVGQFFALVIVLDGERGGSQVGSVLRYGRQCAEDLLNALRHMGVDAGPTAARDQALSGTAPRPNTGPLRAKTAPLRPKTGPFGQEPAPEAQAGPAEIEEPQLDPELAAAELKALDAAAVKVTRQAAASFWDNVIDGEGMGDVRAGTLSWEQASKLGLVPPQK